MKKVLIINHSGYIGGASIGLFHIVMALKSMADKYEVEAYCPSNPSHVCDLFEKNQVKIIKSETNPVCFSHYSGCNRFILSRPSLINIKNVFFKNNWKEIEQIIKESNPDIVALNSMTMCWMGTLIKKKGIKTICFSRETYTRGMIGLRRSYIKRCLRKSFDSIVFISNNDLKETGSILGKSKVITDKVDLEIYKTVLKEDICKELNINSNTFNIIYLGGPVKLKGAHIILKALSQIDDKNVRLLFLKFDSVKRLKTLKDYKKITHKTKFLLGMDYEVRILKLINRYNLNDRIDFIPTVLNPERYILASDLVVFPSTQPHQARLIYEAGAAKKPIIITEFRQTAEYAKNNINCITFKNGNYVELAEKIQLLKDNNELRGKLVNNNYRQTKMYHNAVDLVGELDMLIKEL